MPSSNTRQVLLRWSGEGLAFHGGADEGVQITVDGDGAMGQTPTQLLLMAVAGCMAIDVLMILEKSRVPVESLEVEAIGERAETVPKRFVSIRLLYRLKGPSEDDQGKMDRAIELSRDKYCSVLHTLDPEIEFDLQVERI